MCRGMRISLPLTMVVCHGRCLFIVRLCTVKDNCLSREANLVPLQANM